MRTLGMSKKHNPLARILNGGSVIAMSAVLLASGGQAETYCAEALAPQPEGCLRSNSDVVVTMPVGENTEMVKEAMGSDFAAQGFSISIDKTPVAGAMPPPDSRRPADIAADAADIDIRFDGLMPRRLLNVSTSDLRAAYRAGDTVRFRASTNYPAYVSRAEVRVIDTTGRTPRTVVTLPVASNGVVDWTMPADGPKEMVYVLRVYDAKGRYDETWPLDLTRADGAFDTHATTNGPLTAAGEGEDRTRRRAIPVAGGMVTVSGRADASAPVRVMGETVPVTPSGEFLVSRIVPAGDRTIDVEFNRFGQPHHIARRLEIPASDWHYVAIADLTFGHRIKDTEAEADPDYERNYAEGRLAYYASGITKKGWSVTSSLDTGEGDIEDIFRRLDEKDPRAVIERLDPEDLYPTYGDDSTSYDDTPTSGRVYLRVEKDDTRFTWGDFKADVASGELLSNTRTLYGAELRSATAARTEDGEARVRGVVYGAQPDTLPQRDILRGTGGSVYFLTRQDISGGSETIKVQVVDPDTGRVISTETLVAGVDYELDYLQGVITLKEPLGSSTSDGGLVGSGVGSYDVNLVAQYEYTPTTEDVDGFSYGGRVEAWATNDLRLGFTAMKESTGVADQKMTAVDAHYKFGEASFVEVEAAETDGPGFSRSLSSDGGLTITEDGVSGLEKAMAYRLDSHIDFADLGWSTAGYAELYYERKEAGFSTLNEDITEDQTLIGLRSEVEISEQFSLGVRIEDFDQEGGDSETEAEIGFAYDLSDAWTLEAALGYLDQVTIGDPTETGDRTDLAARLTYAFNDDNKVWIFGQGTVARSGGLDRDDRIGLGASARLSEKVKVLGEASDGTSGFAANAKLAYSPTADNEVYLGYTLDPTRTSGGYELVGRDRGKVVLGGRYRYSQAFSSFAENSMDFFGERQSMTEAYGITYTPNARWAFTGAMESGTVRDEINGDIERDAFSFGLAYTAEERWRARARFEYRTESGDGVSQDADTWAFAGGFEYHYSDSARWLGNIDALISDNDDDSFRDGKYVEASLGYGLRPIDNERLNVLFKYTYLYDLPGADQVTVYGDTEGDSQKSHVLSVDVDYDLNEQFTLGGKYGYRRSEVAERGTDDFSASTAHLGIMRLDWHVVHNWDAMAEGRIMYTEESETHDTGALLGVYRHIGNNAKVGVGYEWGQVSEDITDLDYESSGVFLNLIAKF